MQNLSVPCRRTCKRCLPQGPEAGQIAVLAPKSRLAVNLNLCWHFFNFFFNSSILNAIWPSLFSDRTRHCLCRCANKKTVARSRKSLTQTYDMNSLGKKNAKEPLNRIRKGRRASLNHIRRLSAHALNMVSR